MGVGLGGDANRLAQRGIGADPVVHQDLTVAELDEGLGKEGEIAHAPGLGRQRDQLLVRLGVGAGAAERNGGGDRGGQRGYLHAHRRAARGRIRLGERVGIGALGERLEAGDGVVGAFRGIGLAREYGSQRPQRDRAPVQAPHTEIEQRLRLLAAHGRGPAYLRVHADPGPRVGIERARHALVGAGGVGAVAGEEPGPYLGLHRVVPHPGELALGALAGRFGRGDPHRREHRQRRDGGAARQPGNAPARGTGIGLEAGEERARPARERGRGLGQ